MNIKLFREHETLRVFHSDYLDYKGAIVQFLIDTAV